MSTLQSTPGESFSCDSCHRRFKWKTELAGLKVKCKCGAKIHVPVVIPDDAPVATATPSRAPSVSPRQAVAKPRVRPVPPAKPVEKPVESEDHDTYDFAALGDVESSGKVVAGEPEVRDPQHLSQSQSQKYKPYRPAKSSGGLLSGIGDKAAAAGSIFRYAMAIGLCVAGIGVILGCWLLGMRHDAFMATAQQTTATITGEPSISKSGRRSSRNNPENWTFSFPVSYTVDGRQFANDVSISGESHLPDGLDSENTGDWKGSNLEVYYDPQNPGKVESGYAAEHSNFLGGYLVGVGLIGGGAWRFIKARNA